MVGGLPGSRWYAVGMNVLAAIVAAVSSFLLGGLWYSKAVFVRPWARAWGLDPDQPPKNPKHPASVFGVSFVYALIAALAFAWWLGPNPPLGYALARGLAAGAGFVATSFGINYQFSNRSPVLLGIDGGYHVGQFLLFGLVLGLWH